MQQDFAMKTVDITELEQVEGGWPWPCFQFAPNVIVCGVKPL
jgi:bacteriocin-like protein